jgi:hypothetical protein
MEAISLAGSKWRIAHLNRNERVLQGIRSRLDDAYRDFVVCPLFGYLPYCVQIEITLGGVSLARGSTTGRTCRSARIRTGRYTDCRWEGHRMYINLNGSPS